MTGRRPVLRIEGSSTPTSGQDGRRFQLLQVEQGRTTARYTQVATNVIHITENTLHLIKDIGVNLRDRA
jgi:hypothetical protein